MKKSTFSTLLTVIVLIPLTVVFSTEHYYLTGTLVILEAMLPFFFRFEASKPQARRLILIALMAAMAAISRTVFAFVPHFKPITAIIMISGFVLGPQAGFLTGAMAAFASNFAFGQGLWTPWQMFAFGFGGFLAGVFHGVKKNAWASAVFGFLAILLFVGPILDCSSLFLFSRKLTAAYVTAIFSAGLIPNTIHAASCALTLLLLSKPLTAKLHRLQTKYDI